MSDDFFNDQQLLAPAGVCRSGEILRAKTMVQWYHMVMVPIWYGITSFLILYSNKCEDFRTSIKSAIITCFRRFDDIYHPSQCWKTNTGYPWNISRQIPYYPLSWSQLFEQWKHLFKFEQFGELRTIEVFNPIFFSFSLYSVMPLQKKNGH